MAEPTDADLFAKFVERVHNEAVAQFSLDVQPHVLPNTIQWGLFAQPHLYTFDPARARKEGLDATVRDALKRIRDDPP